MESLKMLRQAIDYIEDHLHVMLEIDDIAKAALSSRYHLQRMFHALTGFTVTEYIRNRRLTLAAEELASTVISKSVDIRTDAFKEIPEFAEKIWKDGTHDRINEATGRSAGMLLYGYHFDFKEDGSRRYMMGFDFPKGSDAPPEFTVLHVPARTYAVESICEITP
ncbi:hypothetical protein M3650_11285 [Paenibacillus sp. MER TA 81-3]|uniref:effector binding domain-containing protein n=1 Tax=Paenibacillus sp. MER TA 81-3 TaxID=2939573 RepID=UPI00203A5F9F|nr:effector binding domain-containing protein [Paenibacillus sp. MER TA 81-3]MCM3339206.1 hypothetical protein [Paenibacillus sp. MER TA 81-3]